MITKIKFVWENETKNKQRFQEVPDTSAVAVGEEVKVIIGALYVRKDIAGTAKEITVTLDISDEATGADMQTPDESASTGGAVE